jgi:hypothetical protein
MMGPREAQPMCSGGRTSGGDQSRRGHDTMVGGQVRSRCSSPFEFG